MSSRPFAEHTQAAIDGEVQKLLRDAEDRAVGVLKEHRDVLDHLVEMLLAKETVEGSDVYALVGKPQPSDGQGRTMSPDRAVSGHDSGSTTLASS